MRRPSGCWPPKAATSSRRPPRDAAARSRCTPAATTTPAQFARQLIAAFESLPDQVQADRRQRRRLRIDDEEVRRAARGRPGVGRRGQRDLPPGCATSPKRSPACRRRRRASRFSAARRATTTPVTSRTRKECGAEPRALLQIDSRSRRSCRWPSREICCGSAGIFNLVQPEMAATLGQRKAAHIADAGADMVVTSNPGCILQIRAALRDAGQPAAGDSHRRAARPRDTVTAPLSDTTVRRTGAPQRLCVPLPPSCVLYHGSFHRSRSTTRPCATAPRAKGSPSRSPTSCASPSGSTPSACTTSRAAGRARTRRDIEFFEQAKHRTFRRARLAAFGSTRRKDVARRRRRAGPAAARRRDAGRHHLRQDVAAARARGPADDARREPRDDRRHRALPEGARQVRRLRRRARLRRLQGRPRSTRSPPGRRPNARGADVVTLCDTNGGSLPAEIAEHHAIRPRAA